MSKKVAIVGTAETWRDTDWNDPNLEIWTLNDAYMLGMPRIDVMFENHPLDRFFFRSPKQKVSILDVPYGFYVRPEGHLEWLQKFSQTNRVWLQGAPPEGWKEARMFPRAELVEKYRDLLFPDPTWGKEYIASGPSWMLLLAISQGITEIVITGIHLATQREYVDQRPNFEYLLGFAKGQGITIHLPKNTPICKSTHVYSYESRVTVEQDRIREAIARIDNDRAKLQKSLSALKPWQRARTIRQKLDKLNLERQEVVHELMRIDLRHELSRPEWRVA